MSLQESAKLVAPVDTSDGASVNLKLHEIGVRIKTARKALGLTQDALAALIGAKSKSGLQDNESGKNMPGGYVISALVRAGINANWLLTGEGPMLLADLKVSESSVALDMERFQVSIQAVDEGLANSGRTMKPNKKAELVMAVYDLLQEPTVTKERVLKLVTLAA